jgi:hypothetical protein
MTEPAPTHSRTRASFVGLVFVACIVVASIAVAATLMVRRDDPPTADKAAREPGGSGTSSGLTECDGFAQSFGDTELWAGTGLR